MNLRKLSVLGFVILLLLTSAALSSCVAIDRTSTKASYSLHERLKSKRFDDLHLTIYYMKPYLLTWIPVSIDDLTQRQYEYKIIVSGFRLRQYVELIKQMDHASLKEVEDTKNSNNINARLYYVFETEKDGTILSVAMHGEDDCMFVNGIAVEKNTIFYDVVMPFLPKDAAEELERYRHAN